MFANRFINAVFLMIWMSSFFKALAIAGALSLVLESELGERGLPSKHERRDVGVNLTVFVPDSVRDVHKQIFEKLASEGYSVMIDPAYYQMSAHSSHIDSTTVMNLEELVKAARDKGLDVLLKPFINSKDDAFRGVFFTDSSDSWFKDYERIILKQAELANKYHLKGICIGAELDRLLMAYPSRFNDLAHKIRGTGFQGILFYSMGYTGLLDLETMTFLNNLDIDAIGLDFYVPMYKQEERSPLFKGQASMEPFFYLEKAAKASKKPLIISEVGYRSVQHANRRPFDWMMNGLPDETVQWESYKNFLLSMSSAEQAKLPIKGVYFWITDNTTFVYDIDSSSITSARGYSYFRKRAEKEVLHYMQRWY